MPLQGKTKHDALLEFRHAEILEAACKVFARKGYSRASVEDIARAAGIGKGTVYLYYPSKQEIYWEAVKCGLEALCDELDRAVAEAPTSAEKVRAFIAAKLRWSENNRDLYKIYYAEFANTLSQPAFLHRNFRNFHFRQMKLLAAALKDGIRRRLIRRLPPETAAFAILQVTRGVVMNRMLGHSRTEIEEDIDFLFDLTWKGLSCR